MMPPRVPPHSQEAEEYLLSCILLDSADVLPRCIQAEIRGTSFFHVANATAYEACLSLYGENKPVETATLAEYLKAKNQLESVGGYAFIMGISGTITTAQAGTHIETVKKLSLLRDIIRSATGAVEDCYAFTGTTVAEIDELIGGVEHRITNLRDRAGATDGIRGLMEFGLPAENDENTLLGKHRYISRGDSILIVSSAGMGKSALSLEWAILAALGRDFLGIKTQRPLKSLIIQAEDSDGDIGEVVYSICHAHKLTAEEKEQVNRNVIVVRDKVLRGPAFIARLRILVEKIRPDLAWLNPLHSFAGCKIEDATEIGQFLREGLNKANRHNRFAFMVVHHTPKPITGKAVADKKWHEFMYDAAGSAELVNWARAVITLKPTEVDGDFHLVLAKRGKRAGVTEVVKGEFTDYLRPTIKIPCCHSKETIKIEGRTEDFNVIHWQTRTVEIEIKDEEKKGQFKADYENGELLACFPATKEDGRPYSAIARMAAETCGVGKSTFARRVKALRDGGFLEMMPDLTYRRTKTGDNEAEAFLKNTN